MAVNEFVLTSSYVQIASVRSTLTATTTESGRLGAISVADNMGGVVPFETVLQPGDQLWLTDDKDYFARTTDGKGMTIRVEDDT